MQHHERARARAGRPIRPVYISTRPRHKEKAWRGDITGRGIRSRTSERPSLSGERNPALTESQNRPAMRSGRVFPGRSSARARNYTGRQFYVNNQSQRPPRSGIPPNRAALMRLQQHTPGSPQMRRGKIVPRSASASFLARKSTNTWSHFPRPKRKGERAYTKDLAGKPLRTKNFQTQRPVLTNPTLNFRKRVAAGERAYKGPAAGGYVTRRPGQKPWRGDVAHWPLRAGKAPAGKANTGRPVPGKAPGIGAFGVGKYRGNIKANQRRGFANQGEEYAGNIRMRKTLESAPGVSNYKGNIRGGKRAFNNQGEQYTGNIRVNRKRGFSDQGEQYTGSIKTKGKRGFNDQGEEYTGNIKQNRRRGLRDQGEGYAGNIRGGKRGFNDQGEGYSGNIKTRRGFNDQGEEYTGNIKTGKRGFNEQGERYAGNIKVRRGFNDQGEEYTGNIKARRPEKGGGSVSGKLWNNKNTPIAVRPPRGQTQIARYQGNIKAGKGFQNQGEEYSGNIKARKPENGGGSVSGKLWNNNETPIQVRTPKSRQGGDFSGNVRLARNAYKKNPKSADSALPVYGEKNEQGGDFQGHLKLARNGYKRNPNSSDSALPVLKPSQATEKAGGYARGARRDWDYIRNPSSADASLRTREPGRAFARSTDYQGSIKFKKFDLFGKSDLHPDAKFVKLNKNNVPEEKDMLTNFKLWWARLFRKNETQPDNLKEKERKPRYDKGEAGMWYE